MIEISINDMLGSVEALKNVSAKSFPAKVAFQIARINREMKHEIELFEAQRNDLVKKYCKYDDDGNIMQTDKGYVQFEPENQRHFEEEVSALLLDKINLNVEPINMDDIDNVDFTPDELMALMPYIKE